MTAYSENSILTETENFDMGGGQESVLLTVYTPKLEFPDDTNNNNCRTHAICFKNFKGLLKCKFLFKCGSSTILSTNWPAVLQQNMIISSYEMDLFNVLPHANPYS